MKENDSSSFRVSAVIPAYNCGKVMARTITSVLSQTRPVAEIIVVDDGSTDDTESVVKGFGAKVRYIRQENQGASAARNTGIEASSCEWIAFLDGDDEWLPEKQHVQMALLARRPELVWTTANYLSCLCGTERRAEDMKVKTGIQLLAGRDYIDSFLRGCAAGLGWHTDTIIIRRAALEKTGYFRVELQRAEDLDMWWRVAHRWPQIGYTPEALAIYHLGTPESLSLGSSQVEMYGALIERHLQLAAEQGRRADFEEAATYIIRKWIRGMLFDKRGEEINRLMEQFDELLTPGYRRTIRMLTMRPGLTAGILRTISKVVRTFNLRRRVERPPRKIKN